MTTTPITTTEALNAMPPGSQMRATFPDNSQPPITITRTAADYGSASTDHYMLAGTTQWLQTLEWGATLTPTFIATPTN